MVSDKADQLTMKQDSGDHNTAVQDPTGHDSDDQNMVDRNEARQNSTGSNTNTEEENNFIVLPLLQTEEVSSTNNGPNTNYILFWNHAGLEHNRLSHAEVNGCEFAPKSVVGC